MKKPPDKIYLQWYGNDETAEEPYETGCGITWCVDQINNLDLEYTIVPRLTPTEILAKFQREPTGSWTCRVGQIWVRVWVYWPPESDSEATYEYGLRHGVDLENTGSFKKLEDACEDAWNRAIELLKNNLKEMNG